MKGGKIFTLHQKLDAFNLKEQRRSVFENRAETELCSVITDYLFFKCWFTQSPNNRRIPGLIPAGGPARCAEAS